MRVLFGYEKEELKEELKYKEKEEKNKENEIKKWNAAITLLGITILGILVYLVVLGSLGKISWYENNSSTY